MFGFVASAGGGGEVAVADLAEEGGQVLEALGDDVGDAGFLLDLAVDGDHAGGEDEAALAFEDAGPEDEVGDAGFVLDGDEHDAFCGAGFLADEDEAGDDDAAAVAGVFQVGAGDHLLGLEVFADECDGVVSEGESDAAVVFDDGSAGFHGGEFDGGFDDFGLGGAVLVGCGEEGEGGVGEGSDGPDGGAAVEVHGGVGVGFGDAFEGGDFDAGSAPEFVDGGVGGFVALEDDGDGVGFG